LLFLDFLLEWKDHRRLKWIISSRWGIELARSGRYWGKKEPRLRLVPYLARVNEIRPVTSGLTTMLGISGRQHAHLSGFALADLRPPSGTPQKFLPPSKPIYEELVPYEEFRTVVLWGGSKADDIKCTIHRECIHHPRPFEALLYE